MPQGLTRREIALFIKEPETIRKFERLSADGETSLTLAEQAIFEAARASGVAESGLDTATIAFAQSLFALLAPTNDALSRFDPVEKGLVFVSSVSDLPPPSSGAITLRDEYTYHFLSEVDLYGARIVAGQNTTIVGSSSENCRIKSTGLTGAALISSEWTLPMRHITLEAETILDLDATGNANQALDWYGVNFSGSSDIGTIKNYNNFVAASMAFLSASGLVFDGTLGTVAFTDTLFSGNASSAIISIPSTATIERRFRISYSSVIVPSTGTGIDVSTSASVPVEGYIFDTVNFSGSGTYTAGVTYDDNKARWTENRGILNSAAITGYYMHGNATATTISGTGTPTKVAGTTTEIGISQRFTVTSTNRATYDGAIDRDFKVTVICSLSSGNGHQVGIYVAKNGTEINESGTYVTTNASGRIENGACQVVTSLVDTDYLEVFVENNTSATDITVEDLNIIIEALN